MAKPTKQDPPDAEPPRDDPTDPRPEAQTNIEWCSPAVCAAAIGVEDPANRKYSEPTVFRYTRAMAERRWEFTGEPIIFNGQKLMDGYHRCRAVVESGKGQWFVVVRGVPVKAFHHIDHGKSRSFRDTCFVEGIESYDLVASCCGFLAGYSKNHRFANRGLEDDDRWRAYQDYQAEIDHLKGRYQKRHLRALKYVTPGLLLAVHVVLHQKDADIAMDYMESMTGQQDDLDEGHPAIAFREYVRKNALLDDRPSDYQARIGSGLLESWNRFRKGEPVLKFKTPGITPEPI